MQQAVKEKYGAIATAVSTAAANRGCCGPSCGCGDPITSDLYSGTELDGLPEDAVKASLGCGNPTALIDLQPGQVVLDLGSGGGIDVLLGPARRSDRQSVRPGYDRRNARACAGESAKGRGNERRVSARDDRGHSPAGKLRRRHHLQLRHQSLER
jgi:hypothetical protein